MNIYRINSSNGGVPKFQRERDFVANLGLLTDKQQDMQHHGGPERALCLYSLEKVVALQEEGHPIVPGATGENITTTGIDIAEIVPGTRLQLGSQVVIEITSYASPCKKIAGAFLNGEFSRISHKLHPGWSRVYARVIEPGYIHVGDPIMLLDTTHSTTL